MRVTMRSFLLSSLMLALPLLTGCGKDNPVAPQVQTQYEDVTVTLVRIIAVADGDGIEGAGDFTYEAFVNDGTSFRVAGSCDINTGDSYTINRKRVIRIEKGQSYNIDVKFTATEWDKDILGNVYPDSRLDHVSAHRLHSNGSTSAGFSDGERTLTIGGSDLQLRFVYRITTAPVV